MKRKHRIVIVDDEPNIGSSLRLILEGEGYGVTICGSIAEFQPHRAPGRADLYLLDVRLPDGNGIDVLRSLKQGEDPTPVVMISGHATIRDAVEATRIGAFDFLEKPLARDRVLLVIKNALERSGSAAREPAVPRAGRRRAEDDRPERGLPPRRQSGDAGRAIGRRRAADRRIRHRQGAARRAHPPRKPVRVARVRQGQLRGDSHRADRERAVRPRARRIHRRHRHAARQVRAGRRRDDLPGRSRRPARGVAGQAAARAAGRRGAAAWQRAVDPRRGPHHLGHEPRPRRTHRERQVP